MRHITFLLIPFLVLAATPAFAYDDPIENITGGFETFSEEVANSLPMNSTIGLQWSDAYIGQLIRVPPNVGVGLSGGFTTIPIENIQNALESFEKEFNTDLGLGALNEGITGAIGMPIPAAVVDARGGGVMYPFDFGLKAGTTPSPISFSQDGADYKVDYTLVGGDVRYKVFDGPAMIPTISAGGGVNYMSGGMTASGLLGSQSIDTVTLPYDYNDGSDSETDYDLSFSDPDLAFDWQSTVVDMKVQASSSWFILTPYAGAGLSYGRSNAGGSIASEIVVEEGGTSTELTDHEKQDLQDAYDEARKEDDSLPKIDFTGDSGVSVTRAVNGWGMRLFGGTSINFLMARFDISGMYDLNTGSVGGNLGLRVQF